MPDGIEVAALPDEPVLDRETFDRCQSVMAMAQAVQEGRIITVDVPDRLSTPEPQSRRVCKQEHCRDYGAMVMTSTVGGRTAYVCPGSRSDPGTARVRIESIRGRLTCARAGTS